MTTPRRDISTPRRDPLDGIERLLIDGSNLLHALTSGPDPAPPATVIGRLRGAIPPHVRIELVFDGAPERGLRNVRIASGVTVRYSGRESADALLARIVGVDAGIVAGGPPTLVVTDDIDLRRELARRGAATTGTAWLAGRLGRRTLASPSAGRPRPPGPPGLPSARPAGHPAASSAASTESPSSSPGAKQEDSQDEPKRWRPGRGATAKKGNPKRGNPWQRRRRHPR